MILVDTSVWIEFLRKKDTVFGPMRKLLESGAIVTVECVFGELLQGAKSARERKILLEYWDALQRIPMTNLWIEAGELSASEKFLSRGIGLIDAVILVAARRVRARIWTLDLKLMKVLERDERFRN